jgi:oligoendopeptidase F
MQQHLFNKRARGYSSCLEAALYPHQIETSVYDALVESIRKGLFALHDYVDFRKKSLGYEELHLYDLSVPILSEFTMQIPYDEAVSAIIESVACLGKEYQQILHKGLTTDRWVDRYENKRKRSGAYSSGCYTSMPYILLNYHETFQDAMTLTHEAGHSMHSYFSAKHQKYQDHRYPIFLAEVASTFHEELLFRYFLAKAKSSEEKAYLINQKIDGIRSTLFRQTMFAEFERKIHEWTEEDVPLTPALLKEEYLRLNRHYFGPCVFIDEEIAVEWARIPHFYYNFYVYQYATGISAAHVLVERVLHQGEKAKEQYLAFLASGCSKDPLQTLLDAGVDMKTSYPVEQLLLYFSDLVLQLKELLKDKK